MERHPGRLVVAVAAAILTALSFPGQHAGTVSAAPLNSASLRETLVDDESLDPVRWKDAIGEDVYRAKRAKMRLEMWSAANAVRELLEQLKNARKGTFATTTTTTAAPTTTTTTTGKPYVRVPKERIARHNGDGDDAAVPQFNPDGTIMLQLPGKLFGNATNFVLSAAKLFGDFITNTAIRTARFVQLFQPIAGRHLFVQIPTPPSHHHER
ncbi:uncharacterized protein LOC131213428 [Anopheles bellator]|uniref:uncharacterized protein LOC131213428 n=1 Tax=Anopheles bellator TaxID=139047 RepID=UPI0026473C9D|nr:uncharacterized protein LOC131213428 [Anopheles bellator]